MPKYYICFAMDKAKEMENYIFDVLQMLENLKNKRMPFDDLAHLLVSVLDDFCEIMDDMPANMNAKMREITIKNFRFLEWVKRVIFILHNDDDIEQIARTNAEELIILPIDMHESLKVRDNFAAQGAQLLTMQHMARIYKGLEGEFVPIHYAVLCCYFMNFIDEAEIDRLSREEYVPRVLTEAQKDAQTKEASEIQEEKLVEAIDGLEAIHRKTVVFAEYKGVTLEFVRTKMQEISQDLQDLVHLVPYMTHVELEKVQALSDSDLIIGILSHFDTEVDFDDYINETSRVMMPPNFVKAIDIHREEIKNVAESAGTERTIFFVCVLANVLMTARKRRRSNPA